jgi:hypothetical protein
MHAKVAGATKFLKFAIRNCRKWENVLENGNWTKKSHQTESQTSFVQNDKTLTYRMANNYQLI